MEAAGIQPDRINVDSVSQVASGLGTARFVADPARVAWAKSVAALFLGGAAPASRSVVQASLVPTGGSLGKWALGLAALGAVVAVAGRSQRKEAR
jgi:hypothetical protein